MSYLAKTKRCLLLWSLVTPLSILLIGWTIERVDPGSFSYDERLQYTVTYLGIRIGTIEMLNKYNEDTEANVQESHITMRTFSGIPFLSVHTEFYSKLGSDGFFTESVTFDRIRNNWAYYFAMRENSSTDIIIDRGYQDRRNGAIFDSEIDTLQLDSPVHDALTFLSILRTSADTDHPRELDVLIDRSVERIIIEPPEYMEKINVPAFKNKIEAYHVTGIIDFTAIHGLTREYQSWISTDEHRIPLEGRVRIGIGSIKIRLEEYEYRQ
jgi:hypothetical protein